MYQPAHFSETRGEVLHELMRAYPFATLVEYSAGGLAANHLPFELVDGVLHGHVARGNELAKKDGADVLLMFHGPDGYISPNWYPSKQAGGRVVPTWNYAVVHVQGTLRVIEDSPWLRRLLETLVEHHEAGQPHPWHVNDAPADYIEATMRGIVGIEVTIERIEGKFKLSQNHPEANRRGVIEGLHQRNIGDDAALANLMVAQEGRHR